MFVILGIPSTIKAPGQVAPPPPQDNDDDKDDDTDKNDEKKDNAIVVPPTPPPVPPTPPPSPARAAETKSTEEFGTVLKFHRMVSVISTVTLAFLSLNYF